MSVSHSRKPMLPSKFKIAVFASGSGTNAEQIFKHFSDHPRISVVLLLSNRPDAYALQRAKNHRIETVVFNREQLRDGSLITDALNKAGVTHLVLAGFLWLVPEYLIRSYPDRIVNIHPALLPKYGGKGMYGAKVHEAVKSSGDAETGITIHLVNDRYDEGKILFQKSCLVSADHTPDEIAACVHKLEHEYYPRVIERWILEDNSGG